MYSKDQSWVLVSRDNFRDNATMSKCKKLLLDALLYFRLKKLSRCRSCRENLSSISQNVRFMDSVSREKFMDSISRERFMDSISRERFMDSISREKFMNSISRERFMDSISREKFSFSKEKPLLYKKRKKASHVILTTVSIIK